MDTKEGLKQLVIAQALRSTPIRGGCLGSASKGCLGISFEWIPRGIKSDSNCASSEIHPHEERHLNEMCLRCCVAQALRSTLIRGDAWGVVLGDVWAVVLSGYHRGEY